MPSSLFFTTMTTILAITISYVMAQTSCKGRCGVEFYRGYMCQCDYGCLAHEECCKDYESQCTERHSCKGRCGEAFKRGRRCTCDPECMKYNNCCPDHKTHCDAAAEEEAELQKWTSADDPLISPVAPRENYDDFSNDFYDQNFPNLPDDPISKEDLETTSVPKSTSGFEPTQAILPDIVATNLPKPFTQDNADVVYGTVSTISPQTEMAPTLSSENQPTDIDATPSPSDPPDQPPTGSTIPESEPITQDQETGATSPPDSPSSTAVSREPVPSSTAQTGSFPTEDTPYLQTGLEFEASGTGGDKPIEPSTPPTAESEILPSTTPTEPTQPTPAPDLTTTPTSSLDANDTVVMDTTVRVTEGASSSDPTPDSTNTQPTITPGLTETSSPTPGLTETSSLTPGLTETSSLTPGLTETSSLTPGLTETSSPTPGLTETSSLTPGLTETSSLTPGLTETSSPTPGLTETSSPTPGLTETSSLDANANVPETTGDTEGFTSSEPNNAATNTAQPMQPTPTPDLTTTPTSRVDGNDTVVMDTTGVTEGSSSSEPNNAATNPTEPTTTPDLTTIPTSRVDATPAVVPESTGAPQGFSSSEANTASISSIVPTPSSPGPQTDTLSILPPSPTDPTVKDEEEEEGRVTPDSYSSEPNPFSIAATIPTLSAFSSQEQTPDPEEPVLSKEEDAPTSTPGDNPEASELQAPVMEGSGTTDSPDRPGPQTDTLSTHRPSPTDPTVKDEEEEEGRVTSAPTKPPTSKPQPRPHRPPPHRPPPIRPPPAANKPSLVKPTSKPKPRPVDTAQISYQTDDNNDMNLCSGRPVGAVTTLRNGTIVVFRGHYFWLLDRNRIPGPARSITQVWGVPSPVDTVFTRCNCQGKTYIFKGSLYWRFDKDVVDPGYPKLIHQGFDGLRGHITAALSVPQYRSRRESVYFFKRGGFAQKYSYQFGTGSACGRKPQYTMHTVRHRVARHAVSVLEPAINIRVSWRGFPTSVTSAVSVPSRRVPQGYKYYVFSRSTYYNVQMDTPRPAIVVPQLNSPPQQNSANDFFRCP